MVESFCRNVKNYLSHINISEVFIKGIESNCELFISARDVTVLKPGSPTIAAVFRDSQPNLKNPLV